MNKQIQKGILDFFTGGEMTKLQGLVDEFFQEGLSENMIIQLLIGDAEKYFKRGLTPQETDKIKLIVLNEKVKLHKSIPLDGEIQIGNNVFKIEISKELNDIEKGLGYRKQLNQNEGMLFEFPKPSFYKFWMKGMNFPLDIIWISKNHIIDIDKNISHLNKNIFQPGIPVDRVLEINGGLSDKLNIREGQTVKFSFNKQAISPQATIAATYKFKQEMNKLKIPQSEQSKIFSDFTRAFQRSGDYELAFSHVFDEMMEASTNKSITFKEHWINKAKRLSQQQIRDIDQKIQNWDDKGVIDSKKRKRLQEEFPKKIGEQWKAERALRTETKKLETFSPYLFLVIGLLVRAVLYIIFTASSILFSITLSYSSIF